MLALLSQKNSFVFVNKIWHLKALNQYSVAQKIRYRLSSYRQTSKQIYRKLKYSEKVFGQFQGLSSFPQKLALYLSSIFGILKP